MSTLKADTIQSTSGGAATLTKQSAAKAWVNFDGTGTIATRDSLNISGLVDNATGQYTANFLSSMDSSNYSLTAQSGGSGARNWINSPFANRSSSFVKIFTYNTSGSGTDYDSNNETIHGDLA